MGSVAHQLLFKMLNSPSAHGGPDVGAASLKLCLGWLKIRPPKILKNFMPKMTNTWLSHPQSCAPLNESSSALTQVLALGGKVRHCNGSCYPIGHMAFWAPGSWFISHHPQMLWFPIDAGPLKILRFAINKKPGTIPQCWGHLPHFSIPK